MRTPGNIAMHELVGTKVSVVAAPDRGIVGAAGAVAFETKNMLEIDRGGRRPRMLIPKAGAVLDVSWGGPGAGSARIRGDSIAKRPQDRPGRARA